MEQKVVGRQEAIEQGLPRYYTGEACKHGHVSERRTLSGSCIACEVVKKDDERRRIGVARAARGEAE